jgi:hypothetical protein
MWEVILKRVRITWRLVAVNKRVVLILDVRIQSRMIALCGQPRENVKR